MLNSQPLLSLTLVQCVILMLLICAFHWSLITNVNDLLGDLFYYYSRNPIKGNIINQPNGPNVYEGVLKDYTGQVRIII